MNGLALKLPTYTWRGKTYKTIAGLHKAILRVYPGAALAFDRYDMELRFRDRATLKFNRNFDPDGNSRIAANPGKDQPVEGAR